MNEKKMGRVFCLVVLALLIGACVTILVQGRVIARKKSGMESGQAYSMERFLEEEFIPGRLEKETTDELSKTGSVLWGK